METWKPITNFESHYEVSSHGRVRSVERLVNSNIKNNKKVFKKSIILKPNLKKNGYLEIDLCIGNNHKTVLIHRLVAKAFIQNPNNKPYVNHINFNRIDNRVENLEWVTAKENSQHSSNFGRMYSKLQKSIQCIETGKTFTSSYKAAEWLNAVKYGYSKNIACMGRNIRAVCTGKRKSAFGYRWKDLA